MKIVQKCTVEDFKWICKIIIKDLKIGISHEKVLRTYHPEAVDFYNYTSNLKYVCKEFINKDHTLTNILRVFFNNKKKLVF